MILWGIDIEGIDIELTASGPNGERGNINMSANEKIIANAQIININSKVSTTVFSSTEVKHLIEMVTAACGEVMMNARNVDGLRRLMPSSNS